MYHSLARVNRELCLCLLESGQVDLSIVPYEPDEFDPNTDPRFRKLAEHTGRPRGVPAKVHVRHQWPPKFEPPAEGAWVMIQPWEFGGLPDTWVGPMRDQVDELWVPSSWVRDCYIRSGIPGSKVVVVPNGVDFERFSSRGPAYPLATSRTFKFLFVGGTIGRKGIDVLLNAYTRAFTDKDDVALVIKGAGADSYYAGSGLQTVLDEIANRAGAPEIVYVTDTLSEADIARLYRAADALVHPYRGEGFGLPIAEAMATGLPVIVTDSGAARDFCDESNAYLIPSREVPVAEVSGLPPSDAGYWLAEPDTDALAQLMRRVVANPTEARAIARRGQQRIQTFTWPKAADCVLERIRDLAERTPVRFGGAPTRIEPLHLDGRRKTAFLVRPSWESNDWRDAVQTYVRTFTPQDDVTLVIWIDPAQGTDVARAAQLLEATVREVGVDPDAGADLLIVNEPLDVHGRQRLGAAVDWVVAFDLPTLEVARSAGRPALANLTPETWRRAAAGEAAAAPAPQAPEIQNQPEAASTMHGVYVGNNRVLVKPIWGGLLLVPADDLSVGPYLIGHGFIEASLTNFIRRTVKPGHRIVDVGANIGYYTVMFGLLAGRAGRVRAFEANPQILPLLMDNLSINYVREQVTVEQLAVYSAPTKLSFHVSQRFLGNSSIHAHGQDYFSNFTDRTESVTVPADALDNLIPADECIDLVKIDVEGGELEVLRGMRQMFGQRRVASVVFELNKTMLQEQWDPFHELLNDFARQGARFSLLTDDGTPSPVGVDALFTVDFIHSILMQPA